MYGRERGSDRPTRMTKGRLAKLAVQYNLATEYTHYLIVHERADGEKAENLPDVRQVKQMLAAGWGGSGSVRAMAMLMPVACQRPAPCGFDDMEDDIPFDLTDDDMPSVLTSRREETKQAMDDGGTDIPAFLKKQPGDKKATKHEHLNLKDLLKKLIELVNSGLTHPDDFPALANKLNNVPELILLQDFINTIKNQGMRTDEIWVALISWAAKQAGSEYQLTRHAARSIHSLSGAIAPVRFAELMMKLNGIALL